jgi:hydrogenase/urease accessory protein HupE
MNLGLFLGRIAVAWRSLLIILGLLAVAIDAFAHDARPAYLEIRQTSAQRYELIWRTPVLSGMRLPVVLSLPEGVHNVTEPRTQELSDSLIERRVVEAPDGLAGKRIEFTGLQGTITDVLVRAQLHDGEHTTTLVHPSQPWVEIAARSGPLAVAGAFLLHGIEHILLGYDHLLFVLALVLIVRSTRVLVWTITSFTLAHSITLALATLGVVHVPGPPVEATIALSILLLACEIVRLRRGQPSLTARWPWVVAFSFGLLHGFGFAGALSQIGLPQGDIPLALFAFNVGVEVGQLMFIAAVLTVIAAAKRLALPLWVTRNAYPATTAAIGSLAAFWLIERVAGFLA